MAKPEDEPTVRLARDEFTTEWRRLEKHPEAVAASSRIDVTDDYGNLTTWVVDLFRKEGQVTAFVQVGGPHGYTRLLIPPKVNAAIARHFGGLVSKHRRKQARRQREDVAAMTGEVRPPKRHH